MTRTSNQLIQLLPRTDRLRLLSLCEPVDLVLADVLDAPGLHTRHVYFPTAGFISLIATTHGDPGIEVAMLGREGMLGAHLVLGVLAAPLRALVQGKGGAWRIPAPDFQRELTRSSALQRVLQRYVHVLMRQLATSSACTRFHLIGPRLARSLLMSQDRALSDRFRMTQESIAAMLGVRRVGITSAAGVLQQRGLIDYHRGEMHVIDRPGLEAAACSCYASDTQVYADTMH